MIRWLLSRWRAWRWPRKYGNAIIDTRPAPAAIDRIMMEFANPCSLHFLLYDENLFDEDNKRRYLEWLREDGEIDKTLLEIEAQWPKVDIHSLRQTRWYHNLSDDDQAYFDREIDALENRGS